MKCPERMIRASWLVLVLLIAAGAAMAEVSIDILGPQRFQMVILGATEGPDPFGMRWTAYRDIPSIQILNASGSVRGDGHPDTAQIGEGAPMVVWAYNAGGDFDIAVSEWNGTEWVGPVFLTSSTRNEINPKVFLEDDGTAHVVWWTADDDQVYLATRSAGSDIWHDPLRVTPDGESGRWPSVAVFDELLYVAYERDHPDPDIIRQVVVRRRGTSGAFFEFPVADVMRIKPLDVELHVEAGHLWIDWKHGISTFGYAVGEAGGFGAVQSLPWPDDSWIGVEDIRREVRRRVLIDSEDLPPEGQSNRGSDYDVDSELVISNPR